MKKICFCFQIQIPAIPRNFRFFEIEQSHQYLSDSQIRNHVKSIDKNILVHFWEMLKMLSIETNGRFKAGISISGTTLMLLQKIVPHTIAKLNELLKNNCIEFLSEPWSHSILPFTDKKLLSQQISRHDELMNILFGITPKIFIAGSPSGSLKNIETAIARKKKGIFAYANHIFHVTDKQKDLIPKLSNNENVLLINHKISTVLQKIDFDSNQFQLEEYVSKILGHINKNPSPFYPTILVNNPVQSHKPFNSNQVIVWKKIIKQLLNPYGFQYTLPIDVINFFKPNKVETDPLMKNLKHYYLPDFWLSNKMQREALKIQQEINDLLKDEKSTPLSSNWDYIQDMDNLLFMSNKYFKSGFEGRHFTPYSNPYAAYINYMNVLDGIMWRLKNQKTKAI